MQEKRRNAYSGSHVAWLLLLLAVFLLIRLYFLDINSLWYDELHTAVATGPKVSWDSFLHHWLLPDVHPPLFYSLIFFWQKSGMNSDFLLRLVPLFFSIAFLPAVYFLQRQLLQAQQLALYLLLLLLAPYAVYYGAELRSYSMLYCCAVLATAFFHRLLFTLQKAQADSQQRILAWGDCVGLAVCCGLAALTHYFSAFLILGIYLILSFHLLLQKHSSKRRLTNTCRLILPALLAAVPALIWFSIHLESLSGRAGGDFWISNSLAKFGIDFIFQLAGGYFGVLAIVGGLFFAVIFQPKRFLRPEFLVVLFGLLFAVMVSLHTPLITPRNLLVFAPLVCLCLSQNFSSDISRVQQVLAVSFLIVLFFQSAIVLFSNNKQDWRAATDYIRKVTPANCPIPYQHKFDPYMRIYTKELYAYYLTQEEKLRMVEGPVQQKGCPVIYWVGQANWAEVEKQLAQLEVEYLMKDFNYVRVYTQASAEQTVSSESNQSLRNY